MKKIIILALILITIISACSNFQNSDSFTGQSINSKNKTSDNISNGNDSVKVDNDYIISKQNNESQSLSSSYTPPKSPEPSVTTPDESTTEESTSKDTLIIGEKMYITQINDIYLNYDMYKDMTIIVEGMYTLFYNQDGVQNVPVVYRLGPGCCGNDGWGGFILDYSQSFPEDNAWIKVTGTPKLVQNGPFCDLHIVVSELEIMEERGAEFVTQ